MKSVTIKDSNGKVLIKIIHRKNGEFELTEHVSVKSIYVEARDDENHKVWFSGE